MTSGELHLSAIVHRPLLGASGERIGQVRDVVAHLPDQGYPQIAGLVARVGERDVFVPRGEIAGLESGAVQLSVDRLDLRGFDRRPGEILLAADLLGHRVISVPNARLARVQDVTLSSVNGESQVSGVTVAGRPLWERLLLRSSGRQQRQLFLDWLDLEPLLRHVPTAHRRLPFARLARLHPAQLADLVEEASPVEGEEILEAVGENPDLEADVFEELDPEYQVTYLETRPDSEAAGLLASMDPDDAVDLLLKLERERRERILAWLPLPALASLRPLLGYNPDTAGGLMSPEFISVSSGTPVDTVREQVQRSQLPPDVLSALYVVDKDGRLSGSVDVVELLRHGGQAPIDRFARDEPVSVSVRADIPEIAINMTDFNLVVLPVVDDERRLVGVITVDDLLEILVPAEWRVRVRHYPPPNVIETAPPNGT